MLKFTKIFCTTLMLSVAGVAQAQSGWTSQTDCYPVRGSSMTSQLRIIETYDASANWRSANVYKDNIKIKEKILRVRANHPAHPSAYTITWSGRSFKIIGYFVEGDPRRNFTAEFFSSKTDKPSFYSCVF